MAENIGTVSLSHHTMAWRVAAMSGHVAWKLSDVVEECCCVSIRLKETTDGKDITQLNLVSCL
jgi:hypothetical protein